MTGPTKGILSSLHPGGFAAVPVVLLRDSRMGKTHVLAYAAVASMANHKKRDSNGAVHSGIRLRRLYERGKLSRQAARQAIKDLESAGYLRIERRPGRISSYWLLPTPADKGGVAEWWEDRDDIPEDVQARTAKKYGISPEEPPI